MFNPNNAANAKSAKAAKKKALADLKSICEGLIPKDLHEGWNCGVLEMLSSIYFYPMFFS